MPANYYRTEIRFPSETMSQLRALQHLLKVQRRGFISMSELVVQLVEASIKDVSNLSPQKMKHKRKRVHNA